VDLFGQVIFTKGQQPLTKTLVVKTKKTGTGNHEHGMAVLASATRSVAKGLKIEIDGKKTASFEVGQEKVFDATVTMTDEVLPGCYDVYFGDHAADKPKAQFAKRIWVLDSNVLVFKKADTWALDDLIFSGTPIHLPLKQKLGILVKAPPGKTIRAKLKMDGEQQALDLGELKYKETPAGAGCVNSDINGPQLGQVIDPNALTFMEEAEKGKASIIAYEAGTPDQELAKIEGLRFDLLEFAVFDKEDSPAIGTTDAKILADKLKDAGWAPIKIGQSEGYFTNADVTRDNIKTALIKGDLVCLAGHGRQVRDSNNLIYVVTGGYKIGDNDYVTPAQYHEYAKGGDAEWMILLACYQVPKDLTGNDGYVLDKNCKPVDSPLVLFCGYAKRAAWWTSNNTGIIVPSMRDKQILAMQAFCAGILGKPVSSELMAEAWVKANADAAAGRIVGATPIPELWGDGTCMGSAIYRYNSWWGVWRVKWGGDKEKWNANKAP
jgi:hypothetical protein